MLWLRQDDDGATGYTLLNIAQMTLSNADSGYLSNLWGRNPRTQGRNFLRCIGDVANPNYGKSGAWMSHVKTFFVAPSNGSDPRSADGAVKLGLNLTFASGEVDAASAYPGTTANPGSPTAPSMPEDLGSTVKRIRGCSTAPGAAGGSAWILLSL